MITQYVHNAVLLSKLVLNHSSHSGRVDKEVGCLFSIGLSMLLLPYSFLSLKILYFLQRTSNNHPCGVVHVWISILELVRNIITR